MKKIVSIVLNNFKNDSRVLKENISLQNAGYNVQVVALWEEKLKEEVNIQEISVHRIKLKSKNWSKNRLVQLIKYFEFIFKVFKKYKSADIVHCNDLYTLPIGVIVKLFCNKNVKIVYDAHEYEINDRPNEGKMSIQLKYLLEKALIRYADRVITVSNAIAEEYARLYDIPKPALVLNTPPYREIENKDLFRERFGIAGECPIFLYQGGLSGGRGIEILLDAFKGLHDEGGDTIPAIVFMGYGPLKEEIEEISKEYENIHFHPAVSPDVLLEYTGSADFGISLIEDVCLSYRYSLPNKMFEYLMADLPVIVSDLPEMRQIIEENKVGVVARANSSVGLKEAIEEAMRLDREVLQKNIQEVKKIYNWEAQEKVLLGVYEGL